MLPLCFGVVNVAAIRYIIFYNNPCVFFAMYIHAQQVRYSLQLSIEMGTSHWAVCQVTSHPRKSVSKTFINSEFHAHFTRPIHVSALYSWMILAYIQTLHNNHSNLNILFGKLFFLLWSLNITVVETLCSYIEHIVVFRVEYLYTKQNMFVHRVFVCEILYISLEYSNCLIRL